MAKRERFNKGYLLKKTLNPGFLLNQPNPLHLFLSQPKRPSPHVPLASLNPLASLDPLSVPLILTRLGICNCNEKGKTLLYPAY